MHKNLKGWTLYTPGNCKKCAHHFFPTHFSSSVTKLPRTDLQFIVILTRKATMKWPRNSSLAQTQNTVFWLGHRRPGQWSCLSVAVLSNGVFSFGGLLANTVLCGEFVWYRNFVKWGKELRGILYTWVAAVIHTTYQCRIPCCWVYVLFVFVVWIWCGIEHVFDDLMTAQLYCWMTQDI